MNIVHLLRSALLSLVIMAVFILGGMLWYVVLLPPPISIDDYQPTRQAVVQQPIQAYAQALPNSTTLSTTSITVDMVISAFDCSRENMSLQPFVHDAHLALEAAVILRQLQHNGRQLANEHTSDYTLTGSLLLDPSIVARNCAVGGFDVTRVHNLDEAQHIGVALAPVRLYDRSLIQAVVIGR